MPRDQVGHMLYEPHVKQYYCFKWNIPVEVTIIKSINIVNQTNAHFENNSIRCQLVLTVDSGVLVVIDNFRRYYDYYTKGDGSYKVYLCKPSAYPPIQESKKETIQLAKRVISNLWLIMSVYVHILVSWPDDEPSPGSKLVII